MLNSKCNLRLIGSTLLLFVALFLSYYLMRFGIDFNDEPFYILHSQVYKTGTMFPLTSLCYHLWVLMFGDSLIAYRVLAVSLFNLSVIIPSIYYYHLTKNATKAVFTCALLLILMNLSRGGWIGLIGVDSFSTLFAAIFAVSVLSYLSKPTYLNLAVTAIVGATMTWFRFPNLVNVPIAIAAIIYIKGIQDKDFKGLAKAVSSYLCLLIFTLWLYFIMLYDSRAEYIGYMSANNTLDPRSSFLFLITTPLYHTFVNILPALALIVLYAVLAKQASHSRSRAVRITVLALVTLFAVGETLLLWRFNFLNKHIYYVAILWFFIGYALMQANAEGKSTIPIFAIMLCSLISAAGSNTGLIKATTFPLFPLLMIYMKPQWLLSVMVKIAAISIFTLNVFSLQRGTFGDEGLPRLTHKVDNPKLKGLMTCDYKAEYLKNAIDNFSRYCSPEHQPMVVGNEPSRHIFEYLLTHKMSQTLGNPFSGHDFYNDSTYVSAVDAEIKAADAPVAVFFISDYSQSSPSQMEQMISSQFSSCFECDNYKIYY